MRDFAMRLIASGFLAVAAGFLATGESLAQTRYAAVVGVESYPEAVGSAPGAAADAALISERLRRQGFKVVTEINADQAAIKRSVFWLNDQLAAAGPDAVGLFYFAGHGFRLDGRTFLVASDTRTNDALAASGSAIDAEFVLQRLDAGGNAPNFLIIDASGSNGLISRFNLEPGLDAVDPPAGGMVVLSNYPGRLAPARQAGVSSFGAAIAELINSDAAHFSTAIQTLREAVSVKSNGARYAWTAGRVKEDFSFRDSNAENDVSASAGLGRAEPRLAVAATPSVALSKNNSERDLASDQALYVNVFFGTDRVVRMNGGTPTFLAESSPLLSYGVTSVTIPPKHDSADAPSPRWWRYEYSPGSQSEVIQLGTSLRSEEAFFDELRGAVSASDEKQAFVFIHGFNSDFDAAARRTAQLHRDLRFDGAPIFYSWASRGEGTPLAYNRDAAAVDRTVPKLERFLTLVADRTGANKVHLIGHSTGNRALMQALDQIAQNKSTDEGEPFSELILSAPDIDKGAFQDLSRRAMATVERMTMYASRNDQSLKVSRSWNGFPRAGDTVDGVMVLESLQTIDASDVRTELFGGGQDYFSGDRSILADIRQVLTTGADPIERGLEVRQLPPGDAQYWIIR